MEKLMLITSEKQMNSHGKENLKINSVDEKVYIQYNYKKYTF